MVIKYLSRQLPLAKKRSQSLWVDAPDVGRTTLSKVVGIVPHQGVSAARVGVALGDPLATSGDLWRPTLCRERMLIAI